MILKQGVNYIHFLDNIIRPSLSEIGLWSESAETLLLGTAAQESSLGHYLKQLKGPALGVYQIEPRTHKDVWHNFISYRQALKARILGLYPSFEKSIKHNLLVYDLRYATIIARLVYYRSKGALPNCNDINSQAIYWKKNYNTYKGKGKVSDYVHSFNKLCK